MIPEALKYSNQLNCWKNVGLKNIEISLEKTKLGKTKLGMRQH